MRAADLFQKYRASVNPPYSYKDLLTIGATIYILLVIPLTVVSALQARELKGRAASVEIGSAFGPVYSTGTTSVERINIASTTGTAQLDAEENAFLALINDYRAGFGVPALVVSPNLTAAADWMANDLATYNQNCSWDPNANPNCHTDSLGRDPFQRMSAFGYGYNAWKGENLASGCDTGTSCFNVWKNSPGHNDNMLSSNYKAIGIGRYYGASSTYGWYWATDFGGVVDTQTKPDLAAGSFSKIDLSSGSYQVRVQSQVKNIGTASTGQSFQINWSVTNGTSGCDLVSPLSCTFGNSALAAGASNETHIDFNPDPNAPYTVCLTVNSDGVIPESTEDKGNNKVCVTYPSPTPVTKPDLTYGSFSKINLTGGSYQVRIQSQVKNVGTASTGQSFQINWSVTNGTSGCDLVSPLSCTFGNSALAAGASNETHIDFNPTATSYTVCLFVDNINRITSESNENNNQLCQPYTSPTPVAKPDLVADTITRGTPDAPYKYRFQSKVKNNSSVSTGKGFYVRWTVGSNVYTYFNSTLGPYSSRESHQDVNLARGTYQVCFAVDVYWYISESTRSNNSRCQSFTIL